jgi:hypothetical protein
MPRGRSLEDQLLTAMITLHSDRQGRCWSAGELVPVLTRLTGDDVPVLSVSRTLRRFERYRWVRSEPMRDGRPGRPSMAYCFAGDGLVQAQRAAARLFGDGQSWAGEPLRLALMEAPPG